MSYILDALKKSDRERQQENPLHLQPLYEAPHSSKDDTIFRRRWPVLLLAGFLVCGGLWSGWNQWINWTRQEPEGKAPAQAAPAATAPEAKETEGETKESIAEPSLRKIPKPIKIRREREKVVMAPQEETPVISNPPPALSAPGQPPPVLSTPDRPQPVPPAIREPEPGSSAIGQSQPVPPEKPQKSTLPYLHDLPAQVQAEIPKLQFAGHAFANTPSQRLIVINGLIMREGDQIDAVTRLAEITWEGVIIDRKGVRFQVKCY